MQIQLEQLRQQRLQNTGHSAATGHSAGPTARQPSQLELELEQLKQQRLDRDTQQSQQSGAPSAHYAPPQPIIQSISPSGQWSHSLAAAFTRLLAAALSHSLAALTRLLHLLSVISCAFTTTSCVLSVNSCALTLVCNPGSPSVSPPLSSRSLSPQPVQATSSQPVQVISPQPHSAMSSPPVSPQLAPMVSQPNHRTLAPTAAGVQREAFMRHRAGPQAFQPVSSASSASY